MTLEEIIDRLDSLDDSLTICAARSPEWSPDSEAELQPALDHPAEWKLPYFLEVSVAKDVLRAWSFARGGRTPDLPNKCKAVIYYAENDAYLLPEEES